jgi:ligand-binding SRPBCC domain-containing protein
MRDPGGVWRLEREQVLPLPLATVFAFFADPFNLERITPPFLRFRIVTPGPIPMHAGALIDYRLRLHGVPLRWRTRIEAYDPPHSFVDVQLSGPYRRWVHTHRFAEVPEGTEVRDVVEYELPLGPLGAWVGQGLVRGALERIFDFRRAATHRELLG